MATDPENPREFVALWTAHARRVYAYVLTLTNNWADAEDIFQDTSTTLWEKFHEFTPGTDFGAWACRIAYFKACSHLQNNRKFEHLDQLFLDTVAATATEMAAEMEERFQALADCSAKMPEEDRDLVRLRYTEGKTPREIAELVGRARPGVYKSLRRIHEALFECIQRRLAQEHHP